MSLHRIHCSYHKCLTVYFGRVMSAVFNRCLPWSSGYRHYNSHAREFYDGFDRHRIASINNRTLDLERLERLGRFRISRFIRDPRDLVVSGYFYHRRGAEPWLRIEAPTEEDWYFANGCIPEGLRSAGSSFTDYLQSLPQEEGLLAELEFRTRHFESMERWPVEHPDILVLRYEEVLGREEAAFSELFAFYELSAVERGLGRWFARRYALGNRRGDAHVRNPKAGQWREVFTPRLQQAFDARWAGLVKRLGYPAE